MNDTLNLLLGMECPKLPEKKVKIKRLTKECGADVIFSLRALPYNRVAEIKETTGGDMSVDILLAGVVEPDLKNGELARKYHAATPAELVKGMLLPGEIEDLSREVEKLSGFRTATIDEVKKN